jgi:tetratricopeptide (TPR) repeat protein
MIGTARLAIALTLVCFAAPSYADSSDDARAHYRRGTNAFNLGHYLEAVKEYEAAYQMKDDPALLFNIAQAYRLAGENESAVRVYKSYLHQVPDAPNRSEVEKRLAELQVLIEQQHKMQQAPPEGTMPPQPATAEPVVAAPTASATSNVDTGRRWYHDRVAVGLAAGGVASLAAGLGFTIAGNLDLSRAPNAADLQDHDNLRTNGTAFAATGYVLLGVGAALCAGAIIKWAVHPRGQTLARVLGSNPLGGTF